MDINVVINTGEEYEVGFGYTTEASGEYVLVTMYQNRADSDATDDNIIDNLAEGKAYGGQHKTQLEAVNEILDFWFIAPIKSLAEHIECEGSIYWAERIMHSENKPFYIYVEDPKDAFDIVTEAIENGEDSEELLFKQQKFADMEYKKTKRAY